MSVSSNSECNYSEFPKKRSFMMSKTIAAPLKKLFEIRLKHSKAFSGKLTLNPYRTLRKP